MTTKTLTSQDVVFAEDVSAMKFVRCIYLIYIFAPADVDMIISIMVCINDADLVLVEFTDISNKYLVVQS